MKFHPWPTAIVLFFLSIAGLNIGLVVLAVQGYGGLIDQRPYELGLTYDLRRAQSEAFNHSGMTLRLQPKPLHADLLDASGLAVTGAMVTLRALRPNAPEQDVEEQLMETTPGKYSSSKQLGIGRWLVQFVIEHNGNTFRFDRTAFVGGDGGAEFSD